jgi:hypothetical protein
MAGFDDEGKWNPEMAKAEKRRLEDSESKAKATKSEKKKPGQLSSVGKANSSSSKNPKKPSTEPCHENSANGKSSTMPPPRTVPTASRHPPRFWRLTAAENIQAEQFIETEYKRIYPNGRARRFNVSADRTLGKINSISVTSFEIATLSGTSWLSAVTIDSFLVAKLVEFQSVKPHDEYTPCTLLSSHFSYWLLNLKRGWTSVHGMTAQLPPAYLEEPILFPYNVPGHYISCIISKFQRIIYIIDGYQGRTHLELFDPIKEWLTQEHIAKHVEPPDYDSQEFPWQFLSGRSLPLDRPIQKDGTSCGPMTAFTILEYLQYRRLPKAVETFTEKDVPQLRKYMAFTLLKVFQETPERKQLYAARINGHMLSEESLQQHLEWMGYLRRERQEVTISEDSGSSSSSSSSSSSAALTTGKSIFKSIKQK